MATPPWEREAQEGAEAEERRKARERIKIIKREEMPEDVRKFIGELCGRTAGGTEVAPKEEAGKIIRSQNVIPLRRQG